MSHHRSMFRTVLAGVFFLFSVAAFAAAFYLLDGQSLVSPLVDKAVAMWEGLISPNSASTPSPKPPTQLVLPKQMDESFALRVWQEQVDSQKIIRRLVEGDVSSLVVNRVRTSGDEAVMSVRVKMHDGTSGPGEIGLRRFGSDWYVAYATGMRSDESTGMVTVIRGEGPTSSPLPSREQVDTPLLNTVLEEQRKSQSVLREYVAGVVKEIIVQNVSEGPQTSTISLLMKETHGTATAKLIAIRSDRSPEPVWFIARFEKTGSDHPSY